LETTRHLQTKGAIKLVPTIYLQSVLGLCWYNKR
jgi:hypothetical protein